ncbi:uncharacterized protein LOC144116080 isoform X1 [Amblyomma americanum]
MAAYIVHGDELPLGALAWDEIEAVYNLLPEPTPRGNLRECGLLDIKRLDPEEFQRMFRFHKEDYSRPLSALRVREEFVSPQRLRVPGNEALGMTFRRLAYSSPLWIRAAVSPT